MTQMTPREIVHELDRHIVGQSEAKRAVAIALRNRWRRMQLNDELRDEVTPKNILMIGPTGVGKTEIARRLAKLANAPFIKIEATKFTEVGYVGKDVESIIRDLVAGRAMARVMSLVMTVFMIVPIIAPAIGQGVTLISSWQWSFGILGIAGFLTLIWVQIRLPETLLPAARHPLSVRQVSGAYWLVFKTRVSCGYMAASGVIFGALFAFLAASEQVFSDVFGQGEKFALWFAIIALALAVGNLANARLVEKYGMRRISHGVMLAFLVFSMMNIAALHLFRFGRRRRFSPILTTC